MEELQVHQFVTAKSFPHSDPGEEHIELSELCEKNPSDIFVNNNIDNLLQTSFVEIERIASKNDKEETNYSSGENFFLKSNTLFLQSRGMNMKNTMKNKKVQCQIGSGFTSIVSEMPQTLEGKKKRLQILKIIKLLRLIFKQLRQQRSSILKEVSQLQDSSKNLVYQLSMKWGKCLSDYQLKMEEKDEKIDQLSQCIIGLQVQNEDLRAKMDNERLKNCSKIKELQSENLRSLTEINQEYKTNSQLIEELTQKHDQYETEVFSLTQQVNNLNEVLQMKQTEVKKLQYEMHRLQVQNRELNQKTEQLYSKYIQNESKYNEQCQHSSIKDEKTQQTLRLNSLYLKEIQSCKEELKDLKQQNEKIKNQASDVINQQLRNYQQQFNEELVKVKKEFNTQIFNQKMIINQYIAREQLYNQIIEKMQDPLAKKQTQEKRTSNTKKGMPKEIQHQAGKENWDSNVTISKNNFSHCQKGKVRGSQMLKEAQLKPSLRRIKNRSVDFQPQEIQQQVIFKAKNPYKSGFKLAEFLKVNSVSDEQKRLQEDLSYSSFLSDRMQRNIKDYYRWKLSDK